MHGLTILSPHQDDAAFSLYLSLCRWSGLRLNLRVVNFFTISAYAPRAASQSESVPLIRRKEDRRALLSINSRIKIVNLDLLDAPVRFGIDSSSVCELESRAQRDPAETRCIADHIARYSERGLLLAPLALGNHVDHLTVHAAALNAQLSSHRVGFYEDLPYATYTNEDMIRKRVDEVERTTSTVIKPIVIRGIDPIVRKRRAISIYSSQISPEEAAKMAKFADKYGGGERMWIPKRSAAWRTLTY